MADNPSRRVLFEMALEHPDVRHTRSGGLSVSSRAAGWSRPSTFLVTADPAAAPVQAISPGEAARIGLLQDLHLAHADAVRLDRSVGAGAACRVGATLVVERSHAHIAAAWDLLTYPRSRADTRIVCTPGLRVPGYPDGRVIAVDLERRVTRICGTDFPGEAKRAGLRAWAVHTFAQGGLPLHAAVKVTSDGRVAVLAGRPGTGKTTIAFAPRTATSPCLEERVAWLAGGALVPAEDAFFAPTTHADSHPLLQRAREDTGSILLNAEGTPSETVAGPTGRMICSAPGLLAGARPWALFLLVRNQNVLPPVSRLDCRTAAAVFTATRFEGDRAEEAAGMRPTLGGSPLFPFAAAAEGRRLLELLERHEPPVYMLNTWRVGGPAGRAGSYKIEPRESAALVDAICAGAIDWADMDELGCTVAAGVVDPRLLYRRHGREDEYQGHVARLRAKWDAALAAVEAQPALVT